MACATNNKGAEFSNAVAEALIEQRTLQAYVPQVFGYPPEFSCTMRSDIDRAASWRVYMINRKNNDSYAYDRLMAALPEGSAKRTVAEAFGANHNIYAETRNVPTPRECAE